MKKIQNLFLLFFLVAVLLFAQENVSQNQKALVFTHVTVIDATGAPAKADMTVVIYGEKIAKIGKTDKTPIPKDAQVINASGKFMIPGLWDMHVHWYAKEYLPLFIANGVTGVRQMFGFPLHRLWRHEIAKGKLLGPRMEIASLIVDGPEPIWRSSISVANKIQAQQAVAKIKKNGADFVKVYSLLPRDAYFAIVHEAKKQKIPFAGHVPFSIRALEASEAGQKSIEHLTGILWACSSKEKELRKKLLKAMKQGKASVFKVKKALEEQALETYSDKKALALFKRFAKNDTWQCATLLVLHNMAFLDVKNFAADPRLKYMPSSVKNFWNPKNDFRLAKKTKQDYIYARKRYKKYLKIVGAMQKAGVPFIAGTDALNPYCFPGFSLHEELALLVEAGLTPMQALQSATCHAARYLGKQSSLGTVEKNKIADLVLLEANPLKNIHNTRTICGVVMAGKFFAKTSLQKMLTRVENIAKK